MNGLRRWLAGEPETNPLDPGGHGKVRHVGHWGFTVDWQNDWRKFFMWEEMNWIEFDISHLSFEIKRYAGPHYYEFVCVLLGVGPWLTVFRDKREDKIE